MTPRVFALIQPHGFLLKAASVPKFQSLSNGCPLKLGAALNHNEVITPELQKAKSDACLTALTDKHLSAKGFFCAGKGRQKSYVKAISVIAKRKEKSANVSLLKTS